MLTEYIHQAMRKATYELLEDGTFYSEIVQCQGVWANASTLESCREELQEEDGRLDNFRIAFGSYFTST